MLQKRFCWPERKKGRASLPALISCDWAGPWPAVTRTLSTSWSFQTFLRHNVGNSGNINNARLKIYVLKIHIILVTAVSCGDPGDGVGKVTKQSHGYNYNQTVDYACSHGYHDKISAHVAVTLTCLGNGTWSRPAPICIGKDISSIQMFILSWRLDVLLL